MGTGRSTEHDVRRECATWRVCFVLNRHLRPRHARTLFHSNRSQLAAAASDVDYETEGLPTILGACRRLGFGIGASVAEQNTLPLYGFRASGFADPTNVLLHPLPFWPP